ncbi:MAG TPA: TolC family protein [Bryobacteraceae bacterium]|jgi:outer membrane protein TolC|nr:TolC family protein [Bryobacteraceae bacterium]
MRRIAVLITAALAAAPFIHAETHTLTLKQAVARALAQNPEVLMARLDETKAALGVRVAKGPFTPRLGVGSGLAYSNGFPLSIEGSAPAAFEAKGTEYLFNRPQSYAIEQAKETARGAGFATGEKNDEIVYRVASLYIDADRATRLADSAQKQLESLQKVLQTAQARVEEGRELPLTAQEANVNLLRAKQRLVTLESDRDYATRSLAVTLGYGAQDVVTPVEEDRAAETIPANEEAAVETAMNSSRELRRLQSNLAAKDLEIKGDKAQRLPSIDLVAQYALLTKYSHYEEYFAHFQRNNGQIGASIQVPVFVGSAVKAQIEQAEQDKLHIRAEAEAARNRIALDIHQSYLEIRKSDAAKDLAQADLDLARSQLSVVLAQMNEGRSSLRQVEEARFNENEKWIAFYDAQFSAERARLNVLRQTGELMAALR